MALAVLYSVRVAGNINNSSGFDLYFNKKVFQELQSPETQQKIYNAIKNFLNIYWVRKDGAVAFLQNDTWSQIGRNYIAFKLKKPFKVLNNPKELIRTILLDQNNFKFFASKIFNANEKPIIVTFSQVGSISKKTIDDESAQALQQGLVDIFDFDEKFISGYNNLGIIYKEIARQYKSLYESDSFKRKSLFFYALKILNPFSRIRY